MSRTTTRKRRLIVVLASAFLVGSSVGGVATAAVAAGYAFSNNGYYTVAGRQYVNYAFLDAQTNPYAYAQTRTGPYSPSSSPTGYVGSRGRLFIQSTGAMSCEGTTSYSNTSLTYPSNWSNQSCTRYSHGSWYSYGVSYSWNGNGYNPWYTFRTPAVTN